MSEPKHYTSAPYVMRDRLRVGMLPQTDVIDSMRRSWQHMRMWQRNNQIAAYVGYPYSHTNGNLDCAFYPITGFPVLTTGPCYVGGVMRFWQYYCASTPASTTIAWYDAPTGGSAVKTISGTVNYARYQTTEEIPTGGQVELGYIPVTGTTSDDGFKAHRLTAVNLLPSSVGLWTLPTKLLTDAANRNVTDYSLAAGEAIRGFDTTLGTSLGAIAHSMHHSITSDLSLWHWTRRCLFQTPYPTGLYYENTDEFAMASYYHMRAGTSTDLPMSYRVAPRNLRRVTGNIRTQPALVVSTNGAGNYLQLRSAVSGDTWIWQSSGAVTTTLITPSDGTSSDTGALAVDPDEDYIYLECKLSSGGTITVHTVSLWEWPTPDEESTVA